MHQSLATLASENDENEKTHDRVAIDAGEPLCTANRAAFDEALDHTQCGVLARPHRAKHGLGLRLRKRGIARCTAPTLNAPFTVSAEPLAGSVLAFEAGHGLFSACVLREKPYNRFEVQIAASPAIWIKPRLTLAGQSGLLLRNCGLGWWLDRDLYGLTVSKRDYYSDSHADFILPESPVPAGLSPLVPKSFLQMGRNR